MLLNDEDVLTMKPGRLRAVRWTGASVVFQGAMHALNPVQRIGDQLAEAIVLHAKSTRRRRWSGSGDLLEKVGLPPGASRDYPHELSGGQKQRVMIAMALACSPSLIIADEPTTALDVMVQAQVLTLLNELQHELGLAMLFITHDLSVLVEVCDRLAIMYAGRIVEQGPSQPRVRARRPIRTPTALAAAFPAIGDPRFRRAPSGPRRRPAAARRRARRDARSTRGARSRSTSAPRSCPTCTRPASDAWPPVSSCRSTDGLPT